MNVPRVGDTQLDDDVYDALLPMDGWPKGSRGGPRPYWFNTDDRRYVVVVSSSDFGDVVVTQVMETNPDACPRCHGFIAPGTRHDMFLGNQMFTCTVVRV